MKKIILGLLSLLYVLNADIPQYFAKEGPIYENYTAQQKVNGYKCTTNSKTYGKCKKKFKTKEVTLFYHYKGAKLLFSSIQINYVPNDEASMSEWTNRQASLLQEYTFTTTPHFYVSHMNDAKISIVPYRGEINFRYEAAVQPFKIDELGISFPIDKAGLIKAGFKCTNKRECKKNEGKLEYIGFLNKFNKVHTIIKAPVKNHNHQNVKKKLWVDKEVKKLVKKYGNFNYRDLENNPDTALYWETGK